MISIGHKATSKLIQFLTQPAGLNASIASLARSEDTALLPIGAQHLFTENVSSDIAEKSGEAKYTGIYVYCERISNLLKEKFRSFSGTIQVTIDVRVSQDRLEGIDRLSQLYMDALTHTLNQNRGDWGDGLFYSGVYEVSFGAVKHGGRNFIKSSKLTLDVDGSVD